MTSRTVLRAARVITPDGERPACVVMSGGSIQALTNEAPSGARVIDVPDDCVLLPGLVDSHVHVNEPGRTDWEGFASATAAAAAGGVTTIVDMPLNSIPPTIDAPALTVKRQAASGQLAVDVAFWGGAVPGNSTRLRELHDAGVVGFKCFLLPSGVDEFPPLDRGGLHKAMSTIAAFDGLLIAHAEDENLITAARGQRYHDFEASRPPRAEAQAIELLLDETRRTGCRTHIVHLSSAQSLPPIVAARTEGLPVTVETCPHYLSFTGDEVPDGATQFKCCPPFRDEANRAELWRGLLDGSIDVVVSDHSPCTAELKRLDIGDFGAAWGGIASLQLGLSAVWTAGAEFGASLTDIARWMCSGPAALTGLTDRGALAPGLQADAVVFALDEQFVVDPTALLHRNRVTPYAGRTLRGVVRETYLRGEPVDATPRGRLTRPRSAS